MHLTQLLTLGFLAIGTVSAVPNLRTRNQCPGNQEWRGFERQCKCDIDQLWDDFMQKCHFPAHERPSCESGEKAFCAKSEHEFYEFDEHNKFCFDNGHNEAFCCKPEELHEKIHEKYPEEHPPCRPDMNWNSGEKKCKCEKGKEDRDGKCKHPVMEKPECEEREHAFCAKDKNHFCEFGEQHKPGKGS
ncbi:hypothetical protein DL95DRAFT_419228 [Leptodontidium sp. 2 PMI_412]|nr:hypothetical protein DL95DRAFT_419228 [Leptodontidium sp. 2 PMI_412]